jgi:hypothetical protein
MVPTIDSPRRSLLQRRRQRRSVRINGQTELPMDRPDPTDVVVVLVGQDDPLALTNAVAELP